MKFYLACLLFSMTLSVIHAQDFSHVPGTVVCHQPVGTQQYIGSPSLVIMPNGDYIASHDFFGPKSSEWQQAETTIYRSQNKGKTWQKISTIKGAFWSSLFVNKGVLYLLGPDRHHGSVLIRKSSDGGNTWTQPSNKENGLLLAGEYHGAPMPVIEYNGRLWRPMETAHGPERTWGKRYGAMVMSASVNSNLLNAKSWKVTDTLLFNGEFLNGNFRGWLEGNFVVDKENRMWNLLRVDDRSTPVEKLARVEIGQNMKLSFDQSKDFVEFPGGSKKFVIKFDSVSNHYYSLVNIVSDDVIRDFPNRNPATTRNTLMLRKSKDLWNWEDVKIVLSHPDVLHHGFQYVDWLIEKNDIIVLSRTSYFDGANNARNNHDANFLTFHRIENFRN